jgi:predicted dehydrogenase
MITCALLGYGWWGRTITGRIAGSNQIRIRTVVDRAEAARREAGAAGFAVCEDLADALRDPAVDAVIVATRTRCTRPRSLPRRGPASTSFARSRSA